MRKETNMMFTRDAAGYKKSKSYILDEMTAKVLIHRGYGHEIPMPSTDLEPAPKAAAPKPAPAKSAPAPAAAPAPRAAAPKPAPKTAPKAKAMTVPENRMMTAKKTTGRSSKPRAKKNQYETKGVHAKSVDE